MEYSDTEIIFGNKVVHLITPPVAEDAGEFFTRFKITHLGESLLLDGNVPAQTASYPSLQEPHWVYDKKTGGYYFPSSANSRLEVLADQFRFSWLPATDFPPALLYIQFPTSLEQMTKFAEQMTIPITAPIQITHNDESARIIFDKASNTTAYLIARANPRMDSTGYLSGCDQPCAVLISSDNKTLSITAATVEKMSSGLKLFGDWQPAPGEKFVLECVGKAGRTRIKFATGPQGSEEINLIKVPRKGLLGRVLNLFEE